VVVSLDLAGESSRERWSRRRCEVSNAVGGVAGEARRFRVAAVERVLDAEEGALDAFSATNASWNKDSPELSRERENKEKSRGADASRRGLGVGRGHARETRGT
jgi:hypothetical protein